MTKSLFALLFLGLLAFKTSAQRTIKNEVFGFQLEVPEQWESEVAKEVDYEKNDCYYLFLLPLDSRTLPWENSVKFRAKANGYAHSLEDVHLLEYQRLHREYDDLEVIEETSNTLLTTATLFDEKFISLTVVAYENGISYISSYVVQEGEEMADQEAFLSFFEGVTFSDPLADYSDIDNRIAESPDDGTLYYDKAERQFNFHQFESALTDASTALELFPFYGEAFYLRGYIHLAMGDTVAACRDFHSSIREDYLGEFELDDYCNSRRIAEALYEEKMKSPFDDFDPNANHIEYIDSVKQHEYVVLSVRGEPSEQVIRYMSHVNHLFALEYEPLDSIYAKGDGIVQLYAFGILCRKFPDQVNKQHKKILKDNGTVMVLNSNQKDPYEMPIKEIASGMYQSIKYAEEQEKDMKTTQSKVEKFILKHAEYPKSYEPISFEQFHVMHTADGVTLEKEKNSEDYVIGHRYKIKDAEGNEVETYNTFKFDYKFRITIIEGEESSTISAYPPRITEWLDKYGRSLKQKEKEKFGLLD